MAHPVSRAVPTRRAKIATVGKFCPRGLRAVSLDDPIMRPELVWGFFCQGDFDMGILVGKQMTIAINAHKSLPVA